MYTPGMRKFDFPMKVSKGRIKHLKVGIRLEKPAGKGQWKK